MRQDRLPFAATVFDFVTAELVDLTGEVHVHTKLTPLADGSVDLDIHANLDNVAGQGQSSGLAYHATGADFLHTTHVPPDPVDWTPGFRLQPVGPPTAPPDPYQPLAVTLQFSFSLDGVLTGVSILEVDTPAP